MGSAVTGGGRGVLVVTAAPDRRDSTASLRELTRELAAVAATTVEVWFLRDGSNEGGGPVVESPEGRWGGRVRVVDALRTWAPVRLLRRVGLHGPADHLAGLRLRIWQRRFRPDVVVLDDALGGRVLEPGRAPSVIVRCTSAPPADADDEARWTGRVDAFLVAPDARRPPDAAPARAARPTLFEPIRRSLPTEPPKSELLAARTLYGLPDEGPLIVWVADAPMTAPTPSPDALETLGVLAGLDVVPAGLPHTVLVDAAWSRERLAALQAGARSLALAGRVHARPAAAVPLLFAADVVVGARSAVDLPLELALLRSGIGVVDPTGQSSKDLALQVAELVALDRSQRRRAAAPLFDATSVALDVLRVGADPGSVV